MTTTAAPPAATTTTTSTTAAVSVKPSVTPVAASWTNQGCVSDGLTRSLDGYRAVKLTGWKVDECVSTCQAKGFAMAGIEGQYQNLRRISVLTERLTWFFFSLWRCYSRH